MEIIRPPTTDTDDIEITSIEVNQNNCIEHYIAGTRRFTNGDITIQLIQRRRFLFRDDSNQTQIIDPAFFKQWCFDKLDPQFRDLFELLRSRFNQ